MCYCAYDAVDSLWQHELPVVVVWNGVVFVRQGLYQDGVFRFTVEFAANFPDSDCPVSYLSQNRLS